VVSPGGGGGGGGRVGGGAQFQKTGAVANRALTLGTRRLTCVDSTSGRLYSQAVTRPIGRPKSISRGPLTGGASTCRPSDMDANSAQGLYLPAWMHIL